MDDYQSNFHLQTSRRRVCCCHGQQTSMLAAAMLPRTSDRTVGTVGHAPHPVACQETRSAHVLRGCVRGAGRHVSSSCMSMGVHSQRPCRAWLAYAACVGQGPQPAFPSCTARTWPSHTLTCITWLMCRLLGRCQNARVHAGRGPPTGGSRDAGRAGRARFKFLIWRRSSDSQRKSGPAAAPLLSGSRQKHAREQR